MGARKHCAGGQRPLGGAKTLHRSAQEPLARSKTLVWEKKTLVFSSKHCTGARRSHLGARKHCAGLVRSHLCVRRHCTGGHNSNFGIRNTLHIRAGKPLGLSTLRMCTQDQLRLSKPLHLKEHVKELFEKTVLASHGLCITSLYSLHSENGDSQVHTSKQIYIYMYLCIVFIYMQPYVYIYIVIH